MEVTYFCEIQNYIPIVVDVPIDDKGNIDHKSGIKLAESLAKEEFKKIILDGTKLQVLATDMDITGEGDDEENDSPA